jgi:transcriptional regulator with XRE-family HTH domain
LFIHSNIKYLRKLKKLSQESFAQQLGLNRGNIASYEQATHPPIDALLKIASWYNISVDALLKVDLKNSLTLEEHDATVVEVKVQSIQSRLSELLAFAEAGSEDLSKALGCSQEHADQLLNEEVTITLEEVVGLLNTYSWVSAEWLVKGMGSMVNSTSAKLSKVAEPAGNSYYSKEHDMSIEQFMEQVFQRLDKLEGK